MRSGRCEQGKRGFALCGWVASILESHETQWAGHPRSDQHPNPTDRIHRRDLRCGWQIDTHRYRAVWRLEFSPWRDLLWYGLLAEGNPIGTPRRETCLRDPIEESTRGTWACSLARERALPLCAGRPSFVYLISLLRLTTEINKGIHSTSKKQHCHRTHESPNKCLQFNRRDSPQERRTKRVSREIWCLSRLTKKGVGQLFGYNIVTIYINIFDNHTTLFYLSRGL